jgi:hypothetical protein
VAGHRTPECELAEKALAAALAASGVAVDAKGYCAAAEHNLVDAVTPELWLAAKADLERGKGSELDRKFRAAHSSSALVANTFVPMRDGVDIPGVGLFAGLPRLEQERSGGAKGYKPTLDVIVEGEVRDLYIESKCREYLDSGEADFSVAWPKLAAEHLSEAAARIYGDVYAAARTYTPVDAPQLLKDVLAADKAAREQDRDVVLLYAYWEPNDASNFEIFEDHRKQAQQLCCRLDSKRVTALSISYQQLWDHWESHGQHHIAQLRRRYDVSLAGSGPS